MFVLTNSYVWASKQVILKFVDLFVRCLIYTI